MQWGQIKSLLILSFLILDVYLVAQFLEKKELADLAVLEEEPSTIEEQLSAENIIIEDLPEQADEETYITVKQRLFTEEELLDYEDNVPQRPFLFDQYFIASKLDVPLSINEDASIDEITKQLAQVAFYPEEYEFWNWNKELNIIMFFQKKMDRPIYFNQNGLVLLFLNDQNEITFYVQTMLGETESLAEKRKLIEPIRAIETLYMENELNSEDHVTKVNIGFHTRVPFEGDVQVFVPIWKVNVNEKKDFFVNAIEGFTFSTNEADFMTDVIETAIYKLQAKGNIDDAIEEMLAELREMK